MKKWDDIFKVFKGKKQENKTCQIEFYTEESYLLSFKNEGKRKTFPYGQKLLADLLYKKY